MILLSDNCKIEDVETDTCSMKKRGKTYSDTIYTFDIETTSLFNIEGKYTVFDYSKPKEYYSNMEKLAIPYIWQFGIENNVYCGRDFMDFEKVLKQISNKTVTKIIWVHNLSYEFGFLMNIFNKYTIDNMTARDIRKPISFHVVELNITFRCSYMLTGLSLAKSADEYTNVKKLDTLNYDSKVRTPLTHLSDDELKYCEYDIICLYEVIRYYRNKYEHLCKIPLTQTGEVRNELKKHVDFWYIKKQWELVPKPHKYLKLMACFQGGYTHANIINSNRIINNVKSYDLASSYPSIMVTEKFPCSDFLKIPTKYYDNMDKENKCFMFHVKLYNVKSLYFNNYISYSKCVAVDENNMIYDNGRIKDCNYIEMWCTDIDMNIIKKNYKIDKIEYIDIYFAHTDFLDIRVLKFILELYGNKTTLKGVTDKIDIYKKSKGYINSLYGMSVTNPLKNSAKFEHGCWNREMLTMDFVADVLQDAKQSYSTLFYYAVGVWVTAYARRNLYMTILTSHEFDKHVIYCDTDSIKFYGDFDFIFEEYNKRQLKKYDAVCEKFGQLNKNMYMPKDRKGVKHPIGVFEYEEKYKQFKTLGAKKYAYIDESDELHITVSGVKKSGARYLKSLDDFKKGFTWGYKEGGKLAHFYSEEQPHINIVDDDGNVYHNTLDYGVILQPTTYTLGITEKYVALIEYLTEKENRKHEQK